MSSVSVLKGPDGGFRVLGIDLVRGADTRDLRAGGFECRSECGRFGKSFGVHSLDAAGLEEAFCKGGARGEIGRCDEIGKEYFLPRATALEHGVRFVVQR